MPRANEENGCVKRPVVLAVPPFQSLTRPAMGASQLKACLEERGFTTRVVYLGLSFAEIIGAEAYEWISEMTLRSLLGEYVFAHGLFERPAAELEAYANKWFVEGRIADEFARQFGYRDPVVVVRELCQAAAAFCDTQGCSMLLEGDPFLVGFSSSFQQNCASLALARAVKRRRPDVSTVMGGANCADEMGQELFSRFAQLDFLGQGECDHSLVALAQALANGGSGEAITGILARGRVPSPPTRPLDSADLDRLPTPQFDDYFGQLGHASFRETIRPGLVMETSRGCWWGAKHHCTFCGLNADGMVYRSKAPERALAEMKTLVERYSLPRIEVVDNILDMRYFKTLLPKLAADPVGELFFETKANLGREHVALLAQSGVHWIQPGIESLSDRTLELMRKGATGLQNIQLLKWSAEYGIRVVWNWLAGFPGEDDTEIPRLAHEMEAIAHLAPPGGAGSISLHRFSPYFSNPEQWGLVNVRPASAYADVYPFEPDSVKRLAYMFETDSFQQKATGPSIEELRAGVRTWQQTHAMAHLLAIARDDGLFLLDTRPCASRRIHRLVNLERRIYEFVDRVRGEREIVRECASLAPADQIMAALRELVARRLVLERSGRFLALATYALPTYRKYVPFPGGMVLPAPVAKRQPIAQRLRQELALLRGEGETLRQAGQRHIQGAYQTGKAWVTTHAVQLAQRTTTLSNAELNERLGYTSVAFDEASAENAPSTPRQAGAVLVKLRPRAASAPVPRRHEIV